MIVWCVLWYVCFAQRDDVWCGTLTLSELTANCVFSREGGTSYWLRKKDKDLCKKSTTSTPLQEYGGWKQMKDWRVEETGAINQQVGSWMPPALVLVVYGYGAPLPFAFAFCLLLLFAPVPVRRPSLSLDLLLATLVVVCWLLGVFRSSRANKCYNQFAPFNNANGNNVTSNCSRHIFFWYLLNSYNLNLWFLRYEFRS